MESPPLQVLLTSLGRIQHHVYTAVIGLEAVEKGLAKKPDDLDISWKATDLVGSARESRQFLQRSTLVFAAEALREYASQVLRFRGEEVPTERADKIRGLGTVAPPYLAIAPLIVSHWRNRIIHRRAKARLTSQEADVLTSFSEEIWREFKHLDVGLLLKHFESDQPTLKDVTTLLAMSIRFARAIDATLPEAKNAAIVGAWLSALNLLENVIQIEKEATNGGSKDPRARARQFLVTEAPTLARPYYEHGAV